MELWLEICTKREILLPYHADCSTLGIGEAGELKLCYHVCVINPRRMRRRVTVVSFVCVSVCSTSTRFVVDLHGPSKVPTSFKRYYLALNNMDYAKNVLFK